MSLGTGIATEYEKWLSTPMEDPDLLILDEPFNGLDKHGVEEIRELLLDLKAAGKTILLASHNEEDIRILCDHVYEMDGGILRERTA